MSTRMRPEEITNIIKERISNFESRLDVNEVGTVLTIGDGVARVFGLKNVSLVCHALLSFYFYHY